MADLDTLDGLMRRAVLSLAGITDELVDQPQSFRVSSDRIEAGRILVAVSGGWIAGFAAWRPIGDTTAELEGMFVEPHMWGHGIGAHMMDAVYEAVVENGFRNIFVVAIPQAADFYRHSGFGRTGATSTPLGPALTMMKEVREH